MPGAGQKLEAIARTAHHRGETAVGGARPDSLRVRAAARSYWRSARGIRSSCCCLKAPVGLPKPSAASAGRNVCGSDFLPLPGFRRTLDGVERSLVLHAVIEVRRRSLAPSDGVEQVVN